MLSMYVVQEEVSLPTDLIQAETTSYLNIYCMWRHGVTRQGYLSLPPYNRASLKGTGG